MEPRKEREEPSGEAEQIFWLGFSFPRAWVSS